MKGGDLSRPRWPRSCQLRLPRSWSYPMRKHQQTVTGRAVAAYIIHHTVADGSWFGPDERRVVECTVFWSSISQDVVNFPNLRRLKYDRGNSLCETLMCCQLTYHWGRGGVSAPPLRSNDLIPSSIRANALHASRPVFKRNGKNQSNSSHMLTGCSPGPSIADKVTS